MPSKFIETVIKFHTYHMQCIVMKTCLSTFTMIDVSLIEIFSFMFDSLFDGISKATSAHYMDKNNTTDNIKKTNRLIEKLSHDAKRYKSKTWKISAFKNN